MIESINIALVVLVSFFITAFLGPVVIPKLKLLGIGQSIRKEGPKSHLEKEGTPTMGGIMILLGIIITAFIFHKGAVNINFFLILASIVGFGLIGLIDDYIIVVKKDNLGLTAKQKIVLQTLLALTISIVFAFTDELGTSLIVPFVKYNYLNLGLLYIPFMTFIIVGTVNSVNLTDGLDGLASTVTTIVMLFFAVISKKWGVNASTLFSSAVAGSCLGFLVHNSYPAKVFMGDTGSLALGGAVSAVALVLRLPLIIPIVGLIYLVEALSVIIQVYSFKTRGKRVFLMSPLHHHYEQKGWREKKIVLIFSIITLICVVIGFISLK